MHLVGVAHLRPRLLAHGGNRVGIEPAQIVRAVGIPAAALYGLGAALFQRCIVEERIRRRVQHFCGERAGRGEVARDHVDGAALDRTQNGQQAIDVHRLAQAVVHGLIDQRMIRHLAFAHDVFQAGDLVGEHRGEQVLALHPLQRRRGLLAAGEARQRQRGHRIPAPARGEQRRIEQRLHQYMFGGVRVQVVRHFLQRKTVAGRQRQNDRILGCGRLQFEVELAAEALAQGQPPRAVDAASPRRVDHQLGAAGLVEEAFQHQRVLARQHAERGLGAGQVVGELLRCRFVQAELVVQPGDRGRHAAGVKLRRDFLAQTRHAERQFVAAPRRLAQPERDARRRAVRVLHPQAVALDALDAVAGVAELEDVAGHAFDREILVDRAHDDRLRFQHHLVVGGVGNGPAGGQRGESGVAAGSQLPIHRVAVDVRGTRAAAGGETLGQHAHHRIEIGARELAVGMRAAHQRVQRVLIPLGAGDLGDDLLGQHVERLRRHDQRVQFAAAHAIEQGGAFDQVVTRRRKQPCLRRAVDAVTGTAGALQERGDRARRAELADQVDLADVDAQLQRRGCHQHRQLAALESLLGIQPLLFRQTAVMRRHGFLAQPLGQMPRGALGHAPRVDEHQRGAMRLHQLGETVVDQLPAVVRHHRFQRHRWHFDREVTRAGVACINNSNVALRVRLLSPPERGLRRGAGVRRNLTSEGFFVVASPRPRPLTPTLSPQGRGCRSAD